MKCYRMYLVFIIFLPQILIYCGKKFDLSDSQKYWYYLHNSYHLHNSYYLQNSYNLYNLYDKVAFQNI